MGFSNDLLFCARVFTWTFAIAIVFV